MAQNFYTIEKKRKIAVTLLLLHLKRVTTLPSEGSVTTPMRCGEILSVIVTTNFLLCPLVSFSFSLSLSFFFSLYLSLSL